MSDVAILRRAANRAESVIAELSRAVGHTNAVRVLDYLLGSGWTVPEGWAE